MDKLEWYDFNIKYSIKSIIIKEKMNIHKTYLIILKFFVISSSFWTCLFLILFNIKLFFDIELVTEGYGYVTSQSIEEGTAINSDSVLRVTLSK